MTHLKIFKFNKCKMKYDHSIRTLLTLAVNAVVWNQRIIRFFKGRTTSVLVIWVRVDKASIVVNKSFDGQKY